MLIRLFWLINGHSTFLRKVQVNNKLAIQGIQDRAAERVRKREEKRQANLEAITAQASREMPEDVTDVPVDEDWIGQFFDHCQDVSNEQMQTVWARLLAGEVASPGSFSLRTLAVVKVMSKDDANLFTRFCSMVWQTPVGLSPIIVDIAKVKSFAGINLGFTDLVRLDALGLIRFEGIAGFSVKFTTKPRLAYHYYGKRYILSHESARQIETDHAMLTDVGKELAIIAGSGPHEEYRNWIVTALREKGWEVVEVADSSASPHGAYHSVFQGTVSF